MERDITFDKEEYEDDEGYYPISEYFDSQEAVTSGNYGALGRKLTLHISEPKHLDAVILKSDVATISIPEIELEEAPGTGRYLTIQDLLSEMRDKLQASAGYAAGPQRAQFDIFFNSLHKMITGQKPFKLIIDDPLSNSFVKEGATFKVEVETYKRTWEQDSEYGLLKPLPYEENHLEVDDARIQFRNLLKSATKIAAFTGAGISVESGIPAFRQTAEDDTWSNYSPSDAEYGNFMVSPESRQRYWAMKTNFYEKSSKAVPNAAHNLFAYLEKENKLLGIVTQNIDGLHSMAGVPNDKIVCIHGTEGTVTCVKCGESYDRQDVHERIKGGEKVPVCKKEGCDGWLKPGTIMFGEPLNPETVKKAHDMMYECDLLIVVGSSLVVQPANKLPAICLSRDVPVVILNQTETMYDAYAKLVVDAPCAAFVASVQESL